MRKSPATKAAVAAVALLMALASRGGSVPPAAAEAAGPVAQAATLPFQVHLGAIARDGAHLAVTLSAQSAFQGGAVMITANDSVSGTATIFGRNYPLMPDGAGGLVGFAGIGTEDPPGAAALAVSVTRTGGATETLTKSLTILKTQWTVDYIDLPPGVGDLLDPAIVKAEQDRLNAIYGGLTPRKWTGKWQEPVPGPVTAALISGYFGEQRSFNGGPVGGHHGGTDFGVAAGTPVYATNGGVVVLAETLQVRGNMVIIDHGGGIFSGYAHMQSIAVAAGETVAPGQLVGQVGTTGLSTGPHLHWEMSVGGVLVDGLRWLDGSQGF